MERFISVLLLLAALAFPHAFGDDASPAVLHRTAPLAQRAAGDSCPAMPTRAPAGYRTVVRDDFTGPVLDTNLWYRWSGEPGSDPNGWWNTPLNVAGHGMLRLEGHKVLDGGNPAWTSAGEVTSGVGSRLALRYGEYTWCMRADDMPGTSTIVLLWPARAHLWPPEIDFVETMGRSRSYGTSLHYGSPSQNIVIRRGVSGQRSTRWNVYTAIWRPGLVRVVENGRVMDTIVSPAHVPSIPMRFDIQTQAVRPDATIGSTLVHWIVEYAPT